MSRNHPHKDYTELQDRYALVRTRELVVFDPLLAGPRALGGPTLLQLWRRDAFGVLERVHAGDAPVLSEVLGAWLLPNGGLLDISSDREGNECWPTWEEQVLIERAENERERAEKETERAARIELERRLAAIERKVSPGRD